MCPRARRPTPCARVTNMTSLVVGSDPACWPESTMTVTNHSGFQDRYRTTL